MANIVTTKTIVAKIFEIQGKRVMLDRDLAQLYGVSVKVLNQAVRRNIRRFPEDFMYQLTWKEAANLRPLLVTSVSRSQIVTLKQGQNIKYLPHVFTEQGVAMLSSVLNSQRAIKVNIMIMRAFVALKEMLLTHKELSERIEALEKKYSSHDNKIKTVFEAIKHLIEMHRTDRVIEGFKVEK